MIPAKLPSPAVPLPWVYDDGGRAAAGPEFNVGDEINDCMTRAIAIATGRPYREVYDMVEEFLTGWCGDDCASPAGGVPFELTRDLMSEFGWRWVPLRDASLHAGFLPDEPRLIADMPGHLCAVIDGVVYDNHDCRWDLYNDGRHTWVLGVYLPSSGDDDEYRRGSDPYHDRVVDFGPDFDRNSDYFDAYFPRDDDDFDPDFGRDDDHA